MIPRLTGAILVTALLVSGLATCLFAIRWSFAADELQRLQARSDAMARTSTLMQQLAAEAIDYGRRNPAIHPVLNQLNLKATDASPTNRPAPASVPIPAQP